MAVQKRAQSAQTLGRLERSQAGSHALSHVVERARDYAQASHAESTRRGYATGWSLFSAFCAAHGFQSLPAAPQSVVLFATELASRAKLGTIRVRLAAIAYKHREHGLESPTTHEMVRRVVRGVARTIGSAQVKKSAATVEHLRAMLLEIRGNSLKAKRDRAILLLGFAAALRRSEIAELQVDDLVFEERGLRITIRRSKTDQEAEGAQIAVPAIMVKSLCAVRAVRDWLDAADISEGRVFRSFSIHGKIQEHPIAGRDVANLVKRLARKAKLEGDFSGHSLRAGFVTSAARAKVSLDAIARTTRHKSVPILMGYVRPAQAFDDTALTSIVA